MLLIDNQLGVLSMMLASNSSFENFFWAQKPTRTKQHSCVLCIAGGQVLTRLQQHTKKKANGTQTPFLDCQYASEHARIRRRESSIREGGRGERTK
ncbi:hypothetical protein MUK42_21174 [Musa troglodytarum]|uniref:Uncharacterized protein n=1 Tax=Musa troglodytarum TaxID=320322 RepID=A0A9E7JVY6_9LILI|nr:hypothetical protein MUK42_21174 [Musa troglodytarum]